MNHRSHADLAERIAAHPVPHLPIKSHRLHRRKTCKVPSSSVSSSSASSSSTSSSSPVAQAATTKSTIAAKATTAAAIAVDTTAKHTTTAAAASTTTAATSSSGSSGGHAFTLVNKCSSAVKPVVVSTACGYSPRCADAYTAALPSVGSLAAGQTTTINVPDNFVGRIFAQDGSCGASGESCTMLEFNLDADSFYTPNSYDISNIQGFTQSISLGAAGCATVTCTSPSCSCQNAYPIGDMTGCGNDLPVKACGKGNIAFTVVFCP
ncbi:hypothetical protein B0H10DRAFT_1799153 [Mycena sp. CBHHK59/15]|nr:hypothetical protein B0H10DRAFT_1799153 [Mycena sp. CBHHK59/15]